MITHEITMPVINWPRIGRNIAVAAIALCAGSVLAFLIWGAGFVFAPEQPELPFRIVYILFILITAAHVFAWLKGQMK